MISSFIDIFLSVLSVDMLLLKRVIFNPPPQKKKKKWK